MTIFSEGNRFFRDDRVIYVFNPLEKIVMTYGFRPFNERRRFRGPRTFMSHCFYLFSAQHSLLEPPIGREIMIGDYL